MTGPTVDVVVPVLGRPHRALPFTRSLWASLPSAGCARLTVIGERSDRGCVDAWENAVAAGPGDGQVLVIPRPPGSFARKVNHAYRRTSAPWLLMVGDDVEFHPGWLGAALHTADQSQALVVGTNDRGLDRKGRVAPHPMINRRYIAVQGASWDGPGVVCHEGYRHAGPDHEIALVARQRGVWAYAQDAVIEHCHFLSGRAPRDATYRKGMMSAGRDLALLRRRRRRQAPDIPLT